MSEAIYKSSEPKNVTITLDEINSLEVTSLFPLLFFYATILSVGVLGNALVFIVYSLRYRRSPARVYILFLAAIDFWMCLFGLPYHLIDMTHPYTYTNAPACKVLTFLIATLFHMSIFGLIVIAVDRYLKICRPLGKLQISYFGKKRACGAAILAAILMSWPNIILYGPSEMESPVGNITGHACFFETSYLETNYPFIYTMSTLFICIGSTVFLIFAYSLIVRKICTRYKSSKFKLVGKSAFDDTTLTEEVCFKNVDSFPLQRINKDIYETRFSKSAEELNPCLKNTSKCSSINKSHSELANIDRNEDRFVILNSNGSLTFVGDCTGHYDSSKTSLQDSKTHFQDNNDNTEPLLKENRKEFHTMNLNAKGNTCVFDPGTTDNNISKGKLYLSGSNRGLNNNSLTKCHEMSMQSLYDASFNSSGYSNRKSNLSSVSAVDLTGLRKSGRYSLQVPSALTPFNSRISSRRTSDITGSNYNKTVQKWRNYSALALKNGMNPTHFVQDEGLRIHTSCHSVNNLSSQGTFKVKKTITRQHSKITKIMLTITIIFILSYSPALIVTIWTAVQPEFWDILDEKETVICEFFLRFYILNNVCNPFIYGFWDKRFKREVIYTLRKFMTSLSAKCYCCVPRKTVIEK